MKIGRSKYYGNRKPKLHALVNLCFVVIPTDAIGHRLVIETMCWVRAGSSAFHLRKKVSQNSNTDDIA